MSEVTIESVAFEWLRKTLSMFEKYTNTVYVDGNVFVCDLNASTVKVELTDSFSTQLPISDLKLFLKRTAALKNKVNIITNDNSITLKDDYVELTFGKPDMSLIELPNIPNNVIASCVITADICKHRIKPLLNEKKYILKLYGDNPPYTIGAIEMQDAIIWLTGKPLTGNCINVNVIDFLTFINKQTTDNNVKIEVREDENSRWIVTYYELIDKSKITQYEKETVDVALDDILV